MTMARRGDHVAALFVAVLCIFFRYGEAQMKTYTLGFLAPSADSAIPSSLADEWNSAFTVAMEVLNSENRTYELVATNQSTECDWQLGQQAAENLFLVTISPPLIGAVGPACTDAAMSVARVFGENSYPLISFAATSETLSNRNNFPTFFRTAFSDQYQGAAIAASVAKLKIRTLTLLTTQQYYSMNLGSAIAQGVGSLASITTYLLQAGDNSTVNSTELGSILDRVGKDEFVIMAVQPKQANDIWTAARNMDKIRYPYWYFGTDGVTAFDPADANATDPSLVNALQGEIGVSPYGGNNTACEKFYSYWKAKKYPGYISEGKNYTRSYVPHLIDAVQAYFLIIDNLIKANVTVTYTSILQALNGSGPGVVQFEGCSGTVSFDKATGSRSVATQVPIYDLVSLTPADWEVKGEIDNGTLLNLQLLTQPGSVYSPNSTYVGPNPNGLSSKTKAGIIVATLLGGVALLVLVGGGTYAYRRRRNHPVTRTESMRRILEYIQK